MSVHLGSPHPCVSQHISVLCLARPAKLPNATPCWKVQLSAGISKPPRGWSTLTDEEQRGAAGEGDHDAEDDGAAGRET